MGCRFSKVEPDNEGSFVRWKQRLTESEANKHFVTEGTLNDMCDKGHIEFRALLEYAIAQDFILKYIKSTHEDNEFSYHGLMELLAYSTLRLDQCEKAAQPLYNRFIKANDYIEKKLREDVSMKLKRAVSFPPSFFFHKVFDQVQFQLFLRIYHDVYVPFKSTPDYKTLCQRLKSEYNRVRPKDFEYLAVLGAGGFGLVCEVRKKSTEARYAMKIMCKKAIPRQFGLEGFRICLEPIVLASCNHSFISSLLCAFQTTSLLIMVTTLGDCCDLAQLQKCMGVVPARNVCFYAAEVVSALSYLHHKDFVHRDLKPANVLLNADGHVMLIDFGSLSDLSGKSLAKCNPPKSDDLDVALFADENPAADEDHRLSSFGSSFISCTGSAANSIQNPNPNSMPIIGTAPSNVSTGGLNVSRSMSGEDISGDEDGGGSELFKRAYSVVGTGRYMAPEMVVLMEGLGFAGCSGYTEAVDWWALGVLMFKLLTNVMPFCADATAPGVPRWTDLIGEVDFGLLDSGPDKFAAEDLLRQLLTVDETKRLGFGGENGSVNVARHEYFKSIDWAQLELKNVDPPPVPACVVTRASSRSGTTTPRSRGTTPRNGLGGGNIYIAKKYDSLEQVLSSCNRREWLTFGTGKGSLTRVEAEAAIQRQLGSWDYTSPDLIASEMKFMNSNETQIPSGNYIN